MYCTAEPSWFGKLTTNGFALLKDYMREGNALEEAGNRLLPV